MLENLDKSTLAMIFFVGLVALFLILVIVTIAVIVSNSRRDDEEEEEIEDIDMDNLEVDNLEEEYASGIENVQESSEDIFTEAEDEVSDSAFGDSYDAQQDSAFADSHDDMSDSAFADSAFVDSAFAEDPALNSLIPDAPTNELDTDQVKKMARKDRKRKKKELTEAYVEEPIEESIDEIEEETAEEYVEEESYDDAMQDNKDDGESVGGDENSEELDVEEVEAEETTTEESEIEDMDKQDSEDEQPSINYDAIRASVREAEEMGAAILDDLNAAQVSAETMFGINEELSKFGSKKNKRERSNVSSDEDFYWYNREDMEDRPSHRKPELYYHYFGMAADIIDDLLAEMYDCALVRTEEIRYIAYGIEPKAYSMKEIMSPGFNLNAGKKKEPSTQDMVRIYEKWCTYVEKLFDKVEIHADEYTIQEIRKQLCAFGRNDVDVLLEGM